MQADIPKQTRKTPTDTTPIPPADVPEEAHPNQRIPLCNLLGTEMSAQTLFCQTARSGPLGRDISWQALACQTARPQRCLTSCCGQSASSHSAQKLGEAIACGTALSWTARPCGCQTTDTDRLGRSSAGPSGGAAAVLLGVSLCPPPDTPLRTLSAWRNSLGHT